MSYYIHTAEKVVFKLLNSQFELCQLNLRAIEFLIGEDMFGWECPQNNSNFTQ